MKKWIGSALLDSQGRTFGTMTDERVYATIPDNDRREIRRKLMAAGINPTVGEIANWYRDFRIRLGR
jgi:hypothetical protein